MVLLLKPELEIGEDLAPVRLELEIGLQAAGEGDVHVAVEGDDDPLEALETFCRASKVCLPAAVTVIRGTGR